MGKKVSVVMTTYNGQKYLREQMDSLREQTMPIDEVIIMDDCSTDHTPDLVSAYIKEYDLKGWNLVQNEQNQGWKKNFKSGFDLATGNYIFPCDQDDIWEPNRVQVSLNHMLEEGSILDVCDRSVIDENGNMLVESYRKAHPNSPEVNWCSGEDITIQAASVCYGIGMALMLDASAAKSMIPFPESTAHDLWLTLGCSELGKCSFTTTPLVKYRRHGGNETGFLAGVASKDDWYLTRVKNRVDTAKQFAERFPDSPHLKEIMGFADARERRSIIGLLKYRRACPSIAKAEIVMRLVPNWLFLLILNMIKEAK